MSILKAASSVASSDKKKYYDPVKTSQYNHEYYEKNKRTKWNYKGVYGKGSAISKQLGIRSTAATPAQRDVIRSAGRTPSSRPTTQSQMQKMGDTSAAKDAASVKNVIGKASKMSAEQLKANKGMLEQALATVRKNKQDTIKGTKTSGGNKAEETTKVANNNGGDVDTQKLAQEWLDQGKLAGGGEEETKETKTSSGSKSAGSSKGSSSGSGKSSTGSSNGTSSGTDKAQKEAEKAKKEAEKTEAKATKTNAKNAKAKTMDGVTYDGLNSKGKSAAKKRKAALAKKKEEELARLNEQYKQQVDAITASSSAGSGELSQRIHALSDKLKSDKAGIEKKYAKKLADVVKKFLKNPRYTSKDSSSSKMESSGSDFGTTKSVSEDKSINEGTKKKKNSVKSKMTGIVR